MEPSQIIARTYALGVIPVIRIERAEDALPLAEALIQGGLPAAEITFRTAAAADAIRRIREFHPEMLLIAGTVLTPDQADAAVDAGADLIVSPGLNPTVVCHCQEKGGPIMPGVSSPSEIEQALSLGISTVKFFPAEAAGGLPAIKAMSAPYGGVRFMPTGGISLRNLPEYLVFPKVLCCGGSFMVPEDKLRLGDFDGITALTQEAVRTVHGFALDTLLRDTPSTPIERLLGVEGNTIRLVVRDLSRTAAYLELIGCPASEKDGALLLQNKAISIQIRAQ